MTTEYFFAKFTHILIAILALGTSAGMGIILELYGDHPAHGSFVLRAIERIEVLFVTPGYVLMLVTGLWMVHLNGGCFGDVVSIYAFLTSYPFPLSPPAQSSGQYMKY
jgi:uncharacterized membrane protein